MDSSPGPGQAGGPSYSSLELSNNNEKSEKTSVSSSRGSVSDTASDVQANGDNIENADDAADLKAPLRTDEKVDASSLEIEYRYFTYATPLPPPNTVAATGDSDEIRTAPAPPNLKKYADPHTWHNKRKYTMLVLSCIATFLTAYAAGAYSPPTQRIADAYGTSLNVVLAIGITVYCMGFAFAPMLLAPLSEYNGRYPVFVCAGTVFVTFQLVSGAATNLATMAFARLLAGVGGSSFSTMVGGVIADMWHAEDRNMPMTLYSGAVLLGTGLGPLVSGLTTYRTIYPQNPHDVLTSANPRAPWRWVFWPQGIADGLLMVALVFLFHESRGSVLMSRKAKALNKWYEEREAAGFYGVWIRDGDAPLAKQSQAVIEGEHMHTHQPAEAASSSAPQLKRIRWVVKEDEERTTVLRTIGLSVYRPFHMLFTESVVFFFSLWMSFAWAVLFLTFGSVFLVFEEVYDFNMEQAGYAFSSMLIGTCFATAFGLYQDRFFMRVLPLPATLREKLRQGVPEIRLCGTCVMSMLLPIGLFIFGFTARPEYHWIGPMFGIGFASMGIFAVYLSTFNYLADVYHIYASSALAAQSWCRNVLGGSFPLIMRPLFVNLGIANATAVLGGIAVGLTLVPWVLLYFGERIRRRSKFAQSLNA
ncbi:hypothetical protein SEPCBS119000_002713 [Sporothrix epigloea]|uniref:Major facilitator superfamily (MFS) profile domain-containing protein n=1 Tax=Sporothrix epigloea TaxID=1892477 RepID=A0ABP0DHM3_9PEZI